MISITRGNALPMITIICDLLLWSHAAKTLSTSLATATATNVSPTKPTTTATTPSLSASVDAIIMANAQIIEQIATVITTTTENTSHITKATMPSARNESEPTLATANGIMALESQQHGVHGTGISLNFSQTSMAVDMVGPAAATTTITTSISTRTMSFHQYCLVHRNSFAPLFTLILYTVVCVVGLFGNTLVIYVVLRFSKMQTVTNIYILNLAIADECFLIGIPFLLSTMRICSWKFGDFLCKAYMVNTSIPQFTSSIFLLIMSADRYMAVCHPITSPRYRTLRIAKWVSALAWLTSAVLMLPVLLYASTVVQEDGVNLSCNIDWPETYERHSAPTFILYTFVLGFATPLTFILVFYCLVIRKLQAVAVKHKSKEKKRSHRKVTRLVLTVITVYVLCWLPYWISQVALISTSPDRLHLSKDSRIIVFLLFGCLSYSNSAMNPILYAFLSDNFRKSFSKAFTCMAHHEVNAQLRAEPSVLTRQGSRKRQQGNGGGGGTLRRNCGDGGGAIDGGGGLICGEHQNFQQQKQEQQPFNHSDQHASSCSGGNNNSSSTTTTTSSTATGTVGSTTEKTNLTNSTLITNAGLSGNDSSDSYDTHRNNGMLTTSATELPLPPENTVLILREEQTICAIMERHRHSGSDPILQTDL